MNDFSNRMIHLVEDTKPQNDILVRTLKMPCKPDAGLNRLKFMEFKKSNHLMPETFGFAVCRKLKKNPMTCHTPNLSITAIDDPQHKLKGLEIGAADNITKPFDTSEGTRFQSRLNRKPGSVEPDP